MRAWWIPGLGAEQLDVRPPILNTEGAFDFLYGLNHHRVQMSSGIGVIVSVKGLYG